MNFKKYLASNALEINQEIENCLNAWILDVSRVDKQLTDVAKLFVDRNFGGKVLRGCLVLLGYRLTGKKYTKEILKPAVAIEIFQTSVLAHDDIVDLSPTRRGKPTIYKALGGDHYAISQTICLGDIGFFLGLKLISDSRFDPRFRTAAVTAFCNMMINTGLGEMLDVELPRLKTGKTEKAVLTIHKLKTSYYTIIYPMTIGALLGGASQALIKHFEVFGENLGIAFQIQDDILGVFGDEKQLGKSVTSDIEEGKNTLLITFALKHASPEQKKILDKYYGKGHIDASGHDLIKKVFEETGSLDYSKKQAKKYVEKAKGVIPHITQDSSLRELLEQFSDFLISRQK